jgi:hypothetical protein
MYPRPPVDDFMMMRGQALLAPPERRPNWWLRLTSMPPTPGDDSFAANEKLRRSRLASWLMLGLFFLILLLIPVIANSTGTAFALGVGFFGLILAALLNRTGLVTLGAVVVIIIVTGGVFGSIITEPNGMTMFDLPGFDALTLTVVVAASLLPPISGFVVAAIDSGLIVADFLLQPHAADLTANVALYGAVGLLSRPIAYLFIIAIVAYLWVQGTHREIRRANQAEEAAAMEHAYAEQSRQLQYGVQQILATHVRIANGDYAAKAPLTQDNVLWQIAVSLNTMTERLRASMSQAAQAGRAAYQLRRTEDEAHRLAVALRDLQQGRRAIWPQPTGTVIDELLAIVSSHRRPAAPPPPAPPKSSWDNPPPQTPSPSAFGRAPSPAGGSPGEAPPWFSSLLGGGTDPSGMGNANTSGSVSGDQTGRVSLPRFGPQSQPFSDRFPGTGMGTPGPSQGQGLGQMPGLAQPAQPGQEGIQYEWPSLEPNMDQPDQMDQLDQFQGIRQRSDGGSYGGSGSDGFSAQSSEMDSQQDEPPPGFPWYLPKDD